MDNMHNNRCLLIALLLLAFVNVGSSLQCYQCGFQMTTKFEIDVCKDPFTKMANIKDCAAQEVCVKHEKTAKPPVTSEQTIRGCTFEDYCSTQEDDYYYCKTCSSDLCNGGSVVTPTIGFFAFLYLVKHYLL